jgi:hypothetical protein
LNQLERQGFVRSFRDGRRKIFSLQGNLSGGILETRE